MFLVLSVIVYVLLNVKIIFVIYKVEYVWIVNMEYLVDIVICCVLLIVNIVYVIYKMEYVLYVSLDGLECIVK